MIDRGKYSVDQTLRYLEVYFIVRLNSENSLGFSPTISPSRKPNDHIPNDYLGDQSERR